MKRDDRPGKSKEITCGARKEEDEDMSSSPQNVAVVSLEASINMLSAYHRKSHGHESKTAGNEEKKITRNRLTRKETLLSKEAVPRFELEAKAPPLLSLLQLSFCPRPVKDEEGHGLCGCCTKTCTTDTEEDYRHAGS
jgi:hypothetical protein